MLISSKYPHSKIQNNSGPNIWAPMSLPSWHIKSAMTPGYPALDSHFRSHSSFAPDTKEHSLHLPCIFEPLFLRSCSAFHSKHPYGLFLSSIYWNPTFPSLYHLLLRKVSCSSKKSQIISTTSVCLNFFFCKIGIVLPHIGKTAWTNPYKTEQYLTVTSIDCFFIIILYPIPHSLL